VLRLPRRRVRTTSSLLPIAAHRRYQLRQRALQTAAQLRYCRIARAPSVLEFNGRRGSSRRPALQSGALDVPRGAAPGRSARAAIHSLPCGAPLQSRRDHTGDQSSSDGTTPNNNDRHAHPLREPFQQHMHSLSHTKGRSRKTGKLPCFRTSGQQARTWKRARGLYFGTR